ncbi:MAG: UTP--glucose-1-phosphate uridylyltransferase GalU [Verrucomicrobia bacterium]|nr:UTP--glucose-1-phosphate uridylyltransferase GalU [Verrucomicrobiota bacterium]MCF7709508.1 UTP--glucose-1-phosphate uridylyltransferase GalU [Verrucomicrobiota bacterium]
MIKKAVIPAAGFGTRFLPAAKSQPKEMLPIVDTPTIQYVVEEAVNAGITDILMVIGKGKRAIEEHFDRNLELEKELRDKGRLEILETIQRISSMANVHFIWQKELKGLGDAVSYAKYHVGNEPFLVLLGDTLIDSPAPITKRLLETFERYNESVVALEEVDPDKVSRYGVIGGRPIADGLFLIEQLIEKPATADAPSNLVIAARYAFTPRIFDYLEKTPPGKNGEIQLTDAMQLMLKDTAMYGLKFEGTRYDIGNKLDFLKTNVVYGLTRDDIGEDFRAFIKEISNGL